VGEVTLAEATFDDIKAELKRRYKSGVILLESESKTNAETDPGKLRSWYWGGVVAACGMMHLARAEWTAMFITDDPAEDE
jgi:hypothetical protein